jgi:hypothetical protein
MELQGSERDYEDIKATLSELLDGYDGTSTIALDWNIWNWKVD